jgi:flagellar motility protein MotE (MotC chaperone)
MNIRGNLHGYLFFFLLAFIVPATPLPSVAAAENGGPQEFGSVEERRLYEDIIKENKALRAEKKDLGSKQLELKTLEEGVDKKLAEIDKKLIELRDLQKKIETLLVAKSEQELKKIQDLAKIYDKMSPDKAALALSGLDKKLAAELLAHMKVKAAAKLLDQMAKQNTTELSKTFSTLQLE